jgi:hypothetical protein
MRQANWRVLSESVSNDGIYRTHLKPKYWLDLTAGGALLPKAPQGHRRANEHEDDIMDESAKSNSFAMDEVGVRVRRSKQHAKDSEQREQLR